MDIKKFESPDCIFRPAPFWSWNDKLDKGELERQIQEMADKGWGGYFMHSRVGLVTGYLSTDWMDLVKACAEKARETGTYAWLYDEDKWPSGFAGGEVPKNEKYRSRALVLLKDDQITENDQVLQRHEHDGVVYNICRRISPLGNAWFNGMSYVDLMNPEAVDAFIKCTHERYKEYCGEYFGKEIPGIFTDEPCYLMSGHYNVPVMPWSDYLPEFFNKLKGYNILSHLTELFFETGDYKRIRFDFFDSATRLFMENFTKRYYDWCEKNNLIMTGHFMAEDNLISQLSWIGAAMPHYQYMHWPGIDKLGRNIEQVVTVKQVTSVVDQLGKERAFCEVFGCVGQQVSFFHRKWIADWQAVLGISFVNHHLSLYSMRGERKRDYPANLYYQQPWWKNEKNFADYIGRLSYTVSQGKRKVDILLLHPIASAWSTYSPIKTDSSIKFMQGGADNFDRLAKELIANKLDFHFGDEIIMEKHCRVYNGKIEVGQHSYSCVVVPPMITLRKNTLKLISEFANYGNLIMMKPGPERIDGIETEIQWPQSIRWASSIEEVLNILDSLYPDRISITDRLSGSPAKKIILQQRALENGEMLLFANTDEKRDISAEIRIPGEHELTAADICSGKLYKIPYRLENGCTILEVKFYPAGSLLLFMDMKVQDANPSPTVLDSGIEFFTLGDSSLIIENWSTHILEENVLPLNDVTLYLNGKKVADRQPLAMVWHNLFYKAEDGTPFSAEYNFKVINIPEGEVFAAIENAENLDCITINGNRVKPMKTPGEMGRFDVNKNWKDISFTKVSLTGFIKQGINTLKIEGKKINNITGPGTHIGVKDFKNHNATEVETVYIVGKFSVVDENRTVFSIDGSIFEPDHKDITSSGYPFYAGSITLTASVNLENTGKKVYLRLNNINAASASVNVNGRNIGLKYWEPFIYDITDAVVKGSNEIEVTLDTTLFNLMGPNRIKDIVEKEYVGPHTFIAFDQYKEKYELLPFGMGNASIYVI
ncbi:MAG: glycoside hydrolase [Firmicutes bacterium]|nr:glycoside hydrolase [Bacillota bacterium]